MPRPKNKEQLLEFSQSNYNKLLALIDNLPKKEQEREFVEGTMNRNIRDVLAHLHHWHLMMKEWYDIGTTGQKPDMPAKGYTWKGTPQLNRKIWEDYQRFTLVECRAWLEESYLLVRNIINERSDEELFEKKRYPWTGSTSLGAYLISATSSHYDWALKMIKKGRKYSA